MSCASVTVSTEILACKITLVLNNAIIMLPVFVLVTVYGWIKNAV